MKRTADLQAIGSFALLAASYGHGSLSKGHQQLGYQSSPAAASAGEAVSIGHGNQNSLKHSRSLCSSGNLIGSLKDLTRKMNMENDNCAKTPGDARLGNKLSSGRVSGGYNSNAGQASNAGQRPQTSVEAAEALIAADAAHRSLAADQALMLRMVMPTLGMQLHTLAQGICKWCEHQGFWPKDGAPTTVKKAEKIALIHSEVSECLEAIRKGDSFNEAEELADAVIRILDYCGYYGIDLGAAIEAKMLQNYQRPFRHGKQF